MVDPDETLLECKLKSGDQTVIEVPIQIRRNLQSMTIGAFCEDGLQAALEIQQAYGQEVFAFSEESSPDFIALLPIRSIQELAKLLKLR